MSARNVTFGRWVAFIERHAWPALVVIAVLAALSAVVAARHARIDSDLSRLIRPSADLAWYQHDQHFKAAFPELQQTAVVVVSGGDGEAVDGAAESLTTALRQRADVEFVYAPGVDPFFRRHRLYYLDEDTLAAWLRGVEVNYGALLRLGDSAGLANAAVTFADQISAGSGLPLPDPLRSLARSFEGDGPPDIRIEAFPPLRDEGAAAHYAVLQLKGAQRHDQALPGAELVAMLEEVVAEAPVADGVDVRLTGEVVLAHEEIGAALRGIGIAGTVSLVLLAVILGFGVRSLRIVAGIFLLLLAGTALTLGFATVSVGTFNTLALMFVIMFFGLGVDFVVHYTLRVRDAHAAGTPDVQATVTAADDLGPALLLCMVTSGIAFLAFVPTAYRGLGELGIISAGGMVIALALTLTLIPALFAAFGMPARSWGGGPPRWHGGTLPPLPVLAVTALLALAALWWAKDLRFDYSVLALRDADAEAMSTLLELQRQGITTDYSISVLADDDAAAELQRRLLQLPEVASVSAPEDWLPVRQGDKQALLAPVASLVTAIEVQPAQHDVSLPDAIDYLAEVGDAVPAERRELYEALLDGLRRVAADPVEVQRLDLMLEAELAAGLADLTAMLTAEPFTLADLPADVRARMITPDGRQLLTVEPATTLASRSATEAFITAVAAVAPNYAGRAVVEWGVGDVVVTAFLQAAAIAVAGIVVALLVFFRSLVLPLLVLAPLALALLFTFALAEVFGLTLNMANILVVPLIFGLGVDSGVHVVHRFARDGSIDAVFESSTARAVTISALTTIGTFFSLSFSPHKGAASVGLLLSMAIGLMLLATYIVLPALLRAVGRSGRAWGWKPHT
ncbi:MAG: MMPL family transporter [Pseudomonadales bacterium]